MIQPRLHKINLVPFILSTPAGKVVFTAEMQALRVALQEEIDSTFTTWEGAAIAPLPKTTQKMYRVWRRVCWDKTYIS